MIDSMFRLPKTNPSLRPHFWKENWCKYVFHSCVLFVLWCAKAPFGKKMTAFSTGGLPQQLFNKIQSAFVWWHDMCSIVCACAVQCWWIFFCCGGAAIACCMQWQLWQHHPGPQQRQPFLACSPLQIFPPRCCPRGFAGWNATVCSFPSLALGLCILWRGFEMHRGKWLNNCCGKCAACIALHTCHMYTTYVHWL